MVLQKVLAAIQVEQHEFILRFNFREKLCEGTK